MASGIFGLVTGREKRVDHHRRHFRLALTSNGTDEEAWRENVQIVLQGSLQMIVNA